MRDPRAISTKPREFTVCNQAGSFACQSPHTISPISALQSLKSLCWHVFLQYCRSFGQDIQPSESKANRPLQQWGNKKRSGHVCQYCLCHRGIASPKQSHSTNHDSCMSNSSPSSSEYIAQGIQYPKKIPGCPTLVELHAIRLELFLITKRGFDSISQRRMRSHYENRFLLG